MLHGLFHTVLQQGGGDVFGGLLGLLHAAAHADAVGGGLEHGQVVGAVTDGQGFGLGNIQGFQQLQHAAGFAGAFYYKLREAVLAPGDDLEIGLHGPVELLRGLLVQAPGDKLHKVRVLADGADGEALAPHLLQLQLLLGVGQPLRVVDQSAVGALVEGENAKLGHLLPDKSLEGFLRTAAVEPGAVEEDLHAAAADPAGEGKLPDAGVNVGVRPPGVYHGDVPLLPEGLDGPDDGGGNIKGFGIDDGAVEIEKDDHILFLVPFFRRRTGRRRSS